MFAKHLYCCTTRPTLAIKLITRNFIEDRNADPQNTERSGWSGSTRGVLGEYAWP